MKNFIQKYNDELITQGVQIIYRVLATSTVLTILATIHFLITSTYPMQKRISITFLPLSIMFMTLVTLLYVQLNIQKPQLRLKLFLFVSYSCYLLALINYADSDIIPLVILSGLILAFMTLVAMNLNIIFLFHLTAMISAILLYYFRGNESLHIGVGFTITLILLSGISSYTSLKYVRLLKSHTSKIKDQFLELKDKDEKSTLLHKASRELVWYYDLETGKREFPDLDDADTVISLSPSGDFEDWVSDLHPDDAPHILQMLRDVADGKMNYFEAEFRRLDQHAEPTWYGIKTISVKNTTGKVTKMAGTYIWIHDKKTKELEIEHLAYHDEMTGTLNRSAFLRDIDNFISNALTIEECFLIYLDIQNFRDINSTFGHQFGDLVIKNVAQRLDGLESDLVIYKLTSTDFGIWGQGDEGTAIQATHQIIELFKSPFNLQGKEIYIQVRMGISLYPNDASDAYSLFRNADTALHHCRNEESLKYLLYIPEMTTMAYSRMNMMNLLHQAIQNKELSLVYQPLIDVHMQPNRIYGFECLLRWSNPQLGHVRPDEFIPLAEESGLIHSLGEWVLYESCRFINDITAIEPEIIVSINISAKQLSMEDFVTKLNHAIVASGVSPENLCLEITESSFIESFEDIGPKIAYIRDQGYQLALDDFGTGYSSLNYLGQLQIDTLKIDKSFSAKVLSSSSDFFLIKSIINLSNDLGLKFVAEGVETLEQLEALIQIGCPIIQGYYFSRPLSKEQAIEYLKLNNTSPS